MDPVAPPVIETPQVAAVAAPAPESAPPPVALAEPVAVVAPAVPEAPAAVLDAPVVEGQPAAPASPLMEAKAADEIAKPAETPAVAATPETPADPAKSAEAAPADPAAPPVEPPLAPVDYKYEVPEGLQFDDASRETLKTVLDGLRKDPTNVQALVDMHVQRQDQLAHHIASEQHRFFGETKRTWADQAMNDPEIGGASWPSTLVNIATVRDRFISPHARGTDEWKADVQAFEHMDQATGVGSNPIFLKFIDRIGRHIKEGTAPTPDARPAPQPKQRGGSLYDNPRSNGRA